MLKRFSLGVLLLGLWITPLQAQTVEAERLTTPGGTEVWAVVDPSLPVVSLSLSFQGGAALDPEGREGLARMVSGLLDEGAGELESLPFQTRLEQQAIELSFDAGQDRFTVSLRTLSDRLEEALGLLRLALTEPRFDEEPVARVRDHLLTRLRFDLQRPGTVAGRAMAETLFPGHPYARPVEGTPESLAAITGEDLRNFTTTRLTRDRVAVGVSGDIDRDSFGALLDQVLEALPGEGVATAIPPVVPATQPLQVIPMAVPQSIAFLAQPALGKDDPDFYPLFLVNHVLGGGTLTSRLGDEVREKRGLAYSVGSGLVERDATAMLYASVSTANDRMAESLAIIRSEWQRMAAEGPTEAELQDAKLFLTGSWPLRFTSTGAVAGMLASMQHDGWPLDHLLTRNDKVMAVTQEDARRAAARILNPEALTIVVVGQPVGLEEGE